MNFEKAGYKDANHFYLTMSTAVDDDGLALERQKRLKGKHQNLTSGIEYLQTPGDAPTTYFQEYTVPDGFSDESVVHKDTLSKMIDGLSKILEQYVRCGASFDEFSTTQAFTLAMDNVQLDEFLQLQELLKGAFEPSSQVTELVYDKATRTEQENIIDLGEALSS